MVENRKSGKSRPRNRNGSPFGSGSQPNAKSNNSRPSEPKRTNYVYENESGKKLFRSVRSEPGRDGNCKSFHQEYLREDGHWVIGLPTHIRRVPFRLPELLHGIARGNTVYVVEGEKDVVTLDAWEVVATTNPMGAGKWDDDYAEHFRDAVEVVVVADNDHRNPDSAARWRGYLHGERVRESIAKLIGAERVSFKMAADGLKDVTDHFNADFVVEDLVDAYPPGGKRPRQAVLTYPELSNRSRVLGPGPWPVLDAAAMYGLAGKVVERLAPHTEADLAGMLTSFLTIFGALVGPGPHAEVEGASHPARLFTVHVGETARSRKGTNYKIIRLAFRNNKHWHDAFEFQGLATGEGLVKDLANTEPPSGKVKPSSEGRDKRRLIVETEFARVLSVGSRDGNTLSALLRQAWDGDTLAIKTRKDPLNATGASVSMIGQVTIEELHRKLTDTEAASGFANRFLYVCLRTSKELPEGGTLPGNLRWELEQEVDEAIERARRLGNVVLKRTDEARERWAEIYHGFKECPHRGLLGAVTARAEAQSLRLQVAYAILDGSDLIELPHVEAAHALWTYCEASAAHIFGGSTGSSDADRIWHALGAADGEQLSRTAVSALFGRNVEASRIDAAVADLVSMGLVRTWTEGSGGRPREMLGKL